MPLPSASLGGMEDWSSAAFIFPMSSTVIFLRAWSTFFSHFGPSKKSLLSLFVLVGDNDVVVEDMDMDIWPRWGDVTAIGRGDLRILEGK